MTVLLFMAAAVLPYLICSVNPAIIVTYIRTGKDIRTMGSGNAGLTNTMRSVGKGAAAVVLVIDLIKGAASVLLVRYLFALFGAGFLDANVQSDELFFVNYIAAAAALLGHRFPLYYKFKGGKSVMVTLSCLLAIETGAALICLGVFVLVLLITGYVSLGSIIAASMIPVSTLLTSLFYYHSASTAANTVLALFIGGMIVYFHKENIVRLKAGTEKRMLHKKKL